MHYNYALENVSSKFHKRLEEYAVEDEDVRAIIQDCIRFIVSEMRKSGRHITKFVLLVDESK